MDKIRWLWKYKIEWLNDWLWTGSGVAIRSALSGMGKLLRSYFIVITRCYLTSDRDRGDDECNEIARSTSKLK